MRITGKRQKSRGEQAVELERLRQARPRTTLSTDEILALTRDG